VPTGLLAPSPLALDSVGVVALREASLPHPSEPAFSQVSAPTEAVFSDLADPRPDSYEKGGLVAAGYASVWFERIHVIPRERNLGAVVSEQKIEVEVWSACRCRSRNLEEIDLEGPAGIEVIDHLGQPAHFPATDSQVYTVEVSAEGDPQIDNLVTWVFTDVDESGTGILILGYRIIPFPFAPNMIQPITESFGYLTDILTAFDGSEQRVQLRGRPVGAIAYAVLLCDPRDAQMAAAILHGNQMRAFAVGRWQFQTPLVQAASADDLTIYCDTQHLPFEVDGLVMLWTNAYHWEVQRISAVESDHLVLSSGLDNAWSAGLTKVLPVVVGRLSLSEPLIWESLSVASKRISFSVDGFRP